MTYMKNTIDTVADVITHQAIRFASSDNADVNAFSSSLFEYVIVPDLSFFECVTDLTLQCHTTRGCRATLSKRTFVSIAFLFSG